jgi:hypothetical protein
VGREGARYVLGPVIPAQENHPPRETWNPTFELMWGPRARDRAALAAARRSSAAAKVGRDPGETFTLPVKDGVYLAQLSADLHSAQSRSPLCWALGVCPAERSTGDDAPHEVFAEWKWEDAWGWDFPMVAMTAASLKEPAMAIDALAMQTSKNTWLPNGHNWQRANLPLYLPGNGGLLLAIAHMVREDCFPRNWKIRHEGFPAGRATSPARRNLYVPNQRPTSRMRAVAGYDAANFLCNIRCCLRAEIVGDKLLYTTGVRDRYRTTPILLVWPPLSWRRWRSRFWWERRSQGRRRCGRHHHHQFFAIAFALWRKPDRKEAKKEYPSSRAAMVSFAAIFFSEWGDVGQVTAATMAARFGSPWLVWAGAVGAMVTKGALAAYAGAGVREWIQNHFSPKTVRYAAVGMLLLRIALGGRNLDRSTRSAESVAAPLGGIVQTS